MTRTDRKIWNLDRDGRGMTVDAVRCYSFALYCSTDEIHEDRYFTGLAFDRLRELVREETSLESATMALEREADEILANWRMAS